MSWPLSQDYNEAIQNPASTLNDPNLQGGEPVVNAMGLPIPRSGNFADVYQFTDSSGKSWALKCFTRPVAKLGERYAAIDKHLREAKLPVTVGFRYHADGIRIRGKRYPMLQMEWVEGVTLNDFVRQHADKPAHLEALFLMWVRLAKRLRQADVAHSDLQHGNVLLVPGSRPATLELKLIDYDGMWVPELARRPSGEAGHASYQHPARRDGAYGFDADRFPHLLIACALRALIVGGQPLWKRFDNGDNLLFREDDFLRPADSDLVRTLWSMNDPIVTPLLANLLLATRGTMAETPWLDHLMASEEVLALTAAQRRDMSRLLGASADVTPEVPTVRAAPAKAADVFAALSAANSDIVARNPARAALSLYWIIPLGALLFGVLLLALPVALLLADRRSSSNEEKPAVTDSQPQPPPATLPSPQPSAPPAPTAPVVEVLSVMPRPMPIEVLTPVWSIAGGAAPRCLDFTRDSSSLVASPGDSASLIIYATATGKASPPMKTSVGRIRALCTAGDNRVIVSGDDNVTALWDIAFGQRLRNIQVPEGDLTPFSATPDGSDALCAGPDGWQVVRYGLDTGMSNRNWTLDGEPRVVDVRYAMDGTRWAAIDERGNVVVVDVKSEKQINLRDSRTSARRVFIASGGRRMLLFGNGAEIRQWDVNARRLLQTFPGHPGGVVDAIITADERWVVSVGIDRKLRIWDAADGREVQDIELPAVATNVRLSPDGQHIATAGSGRLQLWKLK